MRNLELCPECNGYFTVEEIFSNFLGCKESEEISCPHDGCTYYYI